MKAKLFCDKKECYFCGIKEPDTKATCRKLIEIHHIQPRSEGGSNEACNKVCVCSNCHSKVHLGLIEIDRYYHMGGMLWKLRWKEADKEKYNIGPFSLI
jgi:predicted restriction endonuclease